MRNWIAAVGGCIILLASFNQTSGQSPTPLIDDTKRAMMPIAKFRDQYQLDSLKEGYRAPIILIDNFVFIPARGCYDRRHFRGSYEERNNGGDSEKRDAGGDSEKKKTAGVTAKRTADGGRTERDAKGDITARDQGGDDSDRQQAGTRVKRTEGGETSERVNKGDASSRKASGKKAERTEGGETSDRDSKGEASSRTAKGEQTNRSTTGNNQRRKWGGAFKKDETDTTIYCQKSLDQPAFQLSNASYNSVVEVYDTFGRRKVEKLLVEYY